MKVLPFLGIVKEELKKVEELILSEGGLSYKPLANSVETILKSGGKRLRPALTILASKLYPADGERPIIAAAAMELLHAATLIHDDFIDQSPTRRGVPTLNSLWPPAAVVLAGDHLFARAASLAAMTGSPRVVKIFAQALKTICDGEIRQLFGAFGWPQEHKDYYYRIYAKTSSLFEASAEIGGVLSNAPEEAIQALKEYGKNLGNAFQIVDDVLDFTGNEEILGKPAGSDLRQGIVTLPVFYFVENGGDESLVVKALKAGPEERERALKELIERIRSSPAIELSIKEAMNFVGRAKEAIAFLPESPYRSALIALADFAVERNR
ncbi:MAG: polyprenyl synthetase family protein [Anaerolineae bacterium]|nr:polyprenyl synthetase family protein [Anaerolineae bacterium]MDW8101319.1 polyprenyl synthetase family protein [Anaerolineae bacterium]